MKNNKKETFDENNGLKELEKRYKNAEEILNDKDKLENFLERLEYKLKIVPVGGKVLSMIPVMISMLRSYFNKEYKDIPVGTLIAIISALIY